MGAFESWAVIGLLIFMSWQLAKICEHITRGKK